MSSERRIHLIRAVNVGGTARLPMAELRAVAAELGAREVATYIQSGNLLCTPPGHPDDFDRALERAIEQRFGFFREVISRSGAALEAALAGFPFEAPEPKFAYITFLQREPTPEAIAAARRHPTGEDRWQVLGREQYVVYARGAGKAQMNAAAIGSTLGVAGTARNLVTVAALAELARR